MLKVGLRVQGLCFCSLQSAPKKINGKASRSERPVTVRSPNVDVSTPGLACKVAFVLPLGPALAVPWPQADHERPAVLAGDPGVITAFPSINQQQVPSCT